MGEATVPGVVKGLYAWKDDVVVPADWKGSRIFMDIDAAGDYEAFAINDKVVFHPLTVSRRPVTWMDITPWVELGEPNRLTLISSAAAKSWTPGAPEYKAIRIQRVNADAR